MQDIKIRLNTWQSLLAFAMLFLIGFYCGVNFQSESKISEKIAQERQI